MIIHTNILTKITLNVFYFILHIYFKKSCNMFMFECLNRSVVSVYEI